MEPDDQHAGDGVSDAEEAVRLARSVLQGSTPVVLGCHLLFWPLTRLGVAADEEPFATIGFVVAHSAECPVMPHERELWNPQALAREDARLAAWLPQVRGAVLEACRVVVRKFGRNDDDASAAEAAV